MMQPIVDTKGERHFRVLVCPNAYKGSLTAVEAAHTISAGLIRGAAVRLECLELPLADGGDGTLETLVAATKGTVHYQTVRGPLGAAVTAAWGRLGGNQSDTAVIEMAQASGLRLLSPAEYDLRAASTYGTGQLMRAASEAGCRNLVVGIGGSATNDGGAGMAQALGARLLDAQGRDLLPGGSALSELASIDMTDWALPAETRVIVACDVDNPLCGSNGASAIYGPQKGATPEVVEELDAALRHYADVLQGWSGRDIREVPGAGAAGGLGAGLMAFCGGILRPGTDLVLDITHFDSYCRECQLVITGEGRLDAQTTRGKLIAGVTRQARAVGVPVVALVGGMAEGAEETLCCDGLTAAFSIVDGPTGVEEAMRNAQTLLEMTAKRIASLLTLWI